MPALPSKRDHESRLSQPPLISKGKDLNAKRGQTAGSALTGVRNKQGSGGGDVTPTKLKSDAEIPDGIIWRMGNPISLQRTESREAPQVKETREGKLRSGSTNHMLFRAL